MRIFGFLVLVAALLVSPRENIWGVEPPETLRVLTYNIHHAEGIDGKLDLKRIARVILSAQPDIVALQEVDQGTARTERIDQPDSLGGLTAMSVLFGKNIDYEGGGYGNAVLSRFPMKLCENIKLPCLLFEGNVDDREQRGALVVEIQTPAKGPLLFVSTHLDRRRPDKERLASAKLLNGIFVKRYRGRPALLAGDLNSTPNSSVLRRFGEAWQNATSGDYASVPSRNPRRQIDFILCRPDACWKPIEVQVLDEPVASDHLPVLAVFQAMPQNTQSTSDHD